jgi:NarL family two-component system sensor histidine kinase YdfH
LDSVRLDNSGKLSWLYNGIKMTADVSLFTRLRRYLNTINRNPGNEIREMTPFFWGLTIAILIMYSSTLYGNPAMRAAARLIPFTLLMLLHLALYWLSFIYNLDSKLMLGYFIFQALLAFILTLMAAFVGLTLGLYMGLIGETVGVMRYSWKAVILTAVYLGLSATGVVLIGSWGGLTSWVIAIIPLTAFVVVYVVLFMRQVEARERSQKLLEELEAANRQLAEYAGRIEDQTLTAERERMARELHDTLAQGLAGLILQLEAADSHLSGQHPERAQTIIQQAMGRARGTLAEARRAIDDLRSGAIQPADLVEAVQVEVDHFTAASSIPCNFVHDIAGEIPESVREQALRSIGEGLSNIARHSGAKRAWVHISSLPGCLEVEVGDDGSGFDPALAASQPGHYGLLGMRERAHLAGGSLEITGQPGSGTVIRIRLPVR